MNSYLKTDTPTIYADMNVFRYVACGDISISEPERFHWVYSQVHLDEIHRNGNTDALEGIRILGAIEIVDTLNYEFQSVGDIRLKKYIDPYVRYEQYLDAITGYEGISDHTMEYLIRAFGADNFSSLCQAPDQMRESINRLTTELDDFTRNDLLKRADSVSNEMSKMIHVHLKDKIPIDKTRKAMGFTSEIRKILETSQSPIDEIYNLIAPSLNGVSINQFFGFEKAPWLEGIPHTQHGAISSAQIILNMLGISPDQGLAKRDKIMNILSDGQHMGMASYCNAVLSADSRFCNKARAIYTYLGSITNTVHFELKKGMELKLTIVNTK